MARPRKDLDLDMLAKLCAIQCTQEECAAVLSVSADTIDRRLNEKFGHGFADFYKNHCAEGKVSLRRAQFKLALAGNATMLIWLGKQWLDQTDKRDVVVQDTEGGMPTFKVVVPGVSDGT